MRAPRQSRRSGVALALVAPALAAIAVFFFLPVGAAFLLSLTDFDLYAIANRENLRFVGIDNYTRLLGDPLFWRALVNTAWFALLAGPLTIALALGAALALDARMLVGRSFFRTAFVVPEGGLICWEWPCQIRTSSLNADPRDQRRTGGGPGLDSRWLRLRI